MQNSSSPSCYLHYEFLNSEGNCIHKDLFPMTALQITGSIFVFLGTALASAGGISGGPIHLAILVLCFNFRLKNAGPIAMCLIGLSTMTRAIVDSRRKHPLDKSKALIDYDVLQAIICLVCLASQIGVFFSVLLSPVIRLIMMLILILGTTILTVKKGILLCKEERKRKKQKITPQHQSKEDNKNSARQLKSPQSLQSSQNNPQIVRKVTSLLWQEQQNCRQWRKLLIFWIQLIVLIICSLLSGSRSASSPTSLVALCSVEDISIKMVFVAISVVFSVLNIFTVSKRYALKVKGNYPFRKGDPQLTPFNILKLNILHSICEMIGTAVGLGGGFLHNVLLLSFNLNPKVVVSSVLYMGVYIPTFAGLQFLMQGQVKYDYTLWLGMFVILGTITGTLLVQKFIAKTGRFSIIVILLGITMVVVLVLILTFQSLLIQSGEIKPWKTDSLC